MAQYARTLTGVLDPLHTALLDHRTILKTDPCCADFKTQVGKISELTAKSEGGLTPAAAALRLLKQDVVYGRFSPADVGNLQWWIRRLFSSIIYDMAYLPSPSIYDAHVQAMIHMNA